MNVGLALGGGGVRGMAHVLALETIDACGVTPAAIAGTSMGAIIGLLYASGRSGRDVRDFIHEHIISRTDTPKTIYRKKDNLLKWFGGMRPDWSGRGLLNPERFLQHLIEQLGVSTFEDLKIPLLVTATDFHRGEPVVFNSGDLLPAIRASMSIPGVFVPVTWNGRILVDGGLVNNLPYDLLTETCDTTIAIDVAPTREACSSKPPNIVNATLGMFDILVDQATARKLKASPPTIYVRPALSGIGILDFDKIESVLHHPQAAMTDLKSRLIPLRTKT